MGASFLVQIDPMHNKRDTATSEFLGSMLPQYMALCVSQFVLYKKICVSVRWVTLWVLLDFFF